MKDRNEIIYTNEGVEFQTREEKNISIKDIPHIKNPREYFASNISTKKVIAGKQAPMNINITKLKDGYVLSVQCSHACMDGQSFYRMVEHRGKLSRNQDIDLPLLDQSCISQPRTSTKEHILTSALHHGWIKL
ncbi:MAG: acyltransferase [bacterium]